MGSTISKNERVVDKTQLLTLEEKQAIVAQIEIYRMALLKGNKLRGPGRHSTVSLKDLRQNPVSSSSYFKLKEHSQNLKKLFTQLDFSIQIAINFLSQPEIIDQPSLLGYRQMIVRMLQLKTAAKRRTNSVLSPSARQQDNTWGSSERRGHSPTFDLTRVDRGDL